MIGIHFQLKYIENTAEFGDVNRHQYWFGLTDGWYWISLQDIDLFRYATQSQEMHHDIDETLPFFSYYVARLWEDIIDILPRIMEPIPEDLWRRVATIDRADEWLRMANRRLDAIEQLDIWDDSSRIVAWYDERRLYPVPVQDAPGIWFLRVGDTITVRWETHHAMLDGVPVWSASDGEHDVTVSQLLGAVRSFDERLMTQMDERVNHAIASWSRPDVRLASAGLLLEQESRRAALPAALSRKPAPTDWDHIRKILDALRL